MVFGVDKKRAVYLGVKISFGTLVILLLLLIGTQLINSALNREKSTNCIPSLL